jgi:protein CASC3
MFCRPKKKLWAANDRWTHDKFDPVQQTPKSREELIAEYGYDILAHNQPPEEPPNYVR